MRPRSLVILLTLAACGGTVSNPNGMGVDNTPTDDTPAPPPIVATIVGDKHIADETRAVTLSAVLLDVEGVDYDWSFGDGMIASGLTTRHTYASFGCFMVTLTVTGPDGQSSTATARVYVAADVDVSIDNLPRPHALVARRGQDTHATLVVSGTAASPGWEAVAVDVVADGAVVSTFSDTLCSTASEAFEVRAEIPVALTSYELVVRAVVGDRSEPIDSVDDIVAGDAIIIQGQSNAVAANYQGVTLPTHPFVRTFGSAAVEPTTSVADNTWYVANGNVANGAGSIGQWGMHMAQLLVVQHQVPLVVFNGAHGGQPIGFFQRDDEDPENVSTNYGRLLRRTRAAGVSDLVRAVMFFQGESDGANAMAHRDGFLTLNAAWREEHPLIERLYVTQVRPGCGGPTLELRDAQRALSNAIADAHTMSSSMMDAHDGCHYQFNGGYEVLGDAYRRLLSRDLFGVSLTDVEAIDVESAAFDAAINAIRVQTRSDATAFTVETGIASNFTLLGTTSTVTGVTMDGTVMVLQLSAGTGTPTEIRYNAHQGVGATLLNARGVGLLTFILPL